MTTILTTDRINVQLCLARVQLFGAAGPGVDVSRDYEDNQAMSLATIIQFVMNHNAALIESLIALILLVTLFLSYRAFRQGASDESSASHSGDLSSLEETLKKLIAQASLVPAAGSAAVSDTSGATKELVSEIESLKGSLQDKQAEIEKIKAAAAAAPAAAAGSGMSDDMRAQLEAQLKELRGKLEEYEIISEDIADLSFYKEENAKLLKQLETAKSSAPSAPAAPSEPPPVAEAAAPAVAPLETAPEPPPAPVAATAEPPPAPAAPEPAVETVSVGVDDDLMAEFARAVQEQTAGASEAKAPAAPAAAEPKAEAAAPAEESAADLGSMDLDKISAEADGIMAAGAGAGEETPNALEATLDTDKLIQEASDLTSVKAEDKKLMNEFENFVKGS